MTHPAPGDADAASTVIRRLHRMVRHGYRPWLGYDAASGLDRAIELRRKDNTATLRDDGSVTFAAPPDAEGASRDPILVIAAKDAARFDALFPPDAPNRRNIVRRLYEIGVGAW